MEGIKNKKYQLISFKNFSKLAENFGNEKDNDREYIELSKKLFAINQKIANVNEELVVKSFMKEEDQSFLTSGSKKLKDKINLAENPEIFIWGVVTYVIHAL